MHYVQLSGNEYLSLGKETYSKLKLVATGINSSFKDTFKTDDFGLYMQLMAKFDVKSSVI